MASVVVLLHARRPKSTYLQLVDGGYARSQAKQLTDYVRERTDKFGESKQHAIDRLVALRGAGTCTGPVSA